MPRQYTPRVPLVCTVCGAAFALKPSAIRNGQGAYCSRACKHSGQRLSVDRTCLECGAPILRRGTSGKYCSPACYRSNTAIPLPVRFWSKVQKSAECWTWTANHLPKGYGVINVGGRAGRLQLAHRVAWVMASGQPIPSGFHVCHDCPDDDNPACVRNDEPGIYVIRGIARPRYGHLWLGTNDDNMADMAIKARAKKLAIA